MWPSSRYGDRERERETERAGGREVGRRVFRAVLVGWMNEISDTAAYSMFEEIVSALCVPHVCVYA